LKNNFNHISKYLVFVTAAAVAIEEKQESIQNNLSTVWFEYDASHVQSSVFFSNSLSCSNLLYPVQFYRIILKLNRVCENYLCSYGGTNFLEEVGNDISENHHDKTWLLLSDQSFCWAFRISTFRLGINLFAWWSSPSPLRGPRQSYNWGATASMVSPRMYEDRIPRVKSLDRT
jgi:hypothetical protein